MKWKHNKQLFFLRTDGFGFHGKSRPRFLIVLIAREEEEEEEEEERKETFEQEILTKLNDQSLYICSREASLQGCIFLVCTLFEPLY